MTSAKTNLLILTVCNGKQVPIIPPLLSNINLISDFEEKLNCFNNFFTSQCTPLNNNSKIPGNQTYITNATDKLENKDIINIRSLNLNKAQDHDNISIRILFCACGATFNHLKPV